MKDRTQGFRDITGQALVEEYEYHAFKQHKAKVKQCLGHGVDISQRMPLDTYTIPTVRADSSRVSDTRNLPLSVRRLISAPAKSQQPLPPSKTQATTNQRPLTQIPNKKKKDPLHHAAYTVINSLYEPFNDAAPQSNKHIENFLHFPVLRAVENDRGGHFNHHKHEVAHDPFLKCALPGEAGFMAKQTAVVRTLLNRESPTKPQYETQFNQTKATQHSINVQVDRLFLQTRDFIERNDLDHTSGWPRRSMCANRQLNKIENMHDKLEYLHTVFMWIVQGCFDRQSWKDGQDMEAAEARESRKPRHENRTGSNTNLNRSLLGLFGISRKEKSEMKKLVEELRAPKPIPPSDIRSKGWQIRRAEAAQTKKMNLSPGIQLLLKNERRGDGATLEEIQRVRQILRHAHNQAKNGKDHLDFRHDIVTPDSKGLADWIREKENKLFEKPNTSEDQETHFTASEFIASFIQLQSSRRMSSNGADIAGMSPTIDLQSRRASRKSFQSVVVRPIIVNRSNEEIVSHPHRKSVAFKSPSMEAVRPSEMQRRQSVYNRRHSIRSVPLKRPSEILSSGVASTAWWPLFRSEITLIFEKTGWERTENERQVLFKFFRSMAAFAKLSDYVVKEICCTGIKFCEYSKGAVIFRQYDVSVAWHIILSGVVDVLKSYTGDLETGMKMRSLHAGYGFGENGLLKDAIRSASIAAVTACEIIEIQKEDYNKIIKISHRRNVEEMATLLKHVSVFAHWKREALLAIAAIMWFKTAEKGEVIIEQGQPCKELYFVKEGAVCLYKKIRIKDKMVEVKVGIMGPNSILCSEGFIYAAHENHLEGDISSRFTIKAASQAEILLLQSARSINSVDPHKIYLEQQKEALDRWQHEQSKKPPDELVFPEVPWDADSNTALDADFIKQKQLEVQEKSTSGLFMDFRDGYNFAKLETQDWVYEDFDSIVASAAVPSSAAATVTTSVNSIKPQSAFLQIKNSVVTSDTLNPTKRPTMNAIVKPAHLKPKFCKGGVVLACCIATAAKLELRDLGERPSLLDLTDSEVMEIYNATLERKLWQRKKRQMMDTLAKEAKVDCRIRYGSVVGDHVEQTVDLWH
ncbi:Cyclic nucleotide-binding domain-containing protein 2 [Chytriomyces hyalinus]|nr:Cyclic nucleotide-binding domain-containing protein 2 [Chytriomyces hyalinus]